MSFVGIRGDSYLGDISIDDISVGELEKCHLEIGGDHPTADPKVGEYIRELYAVSWFVMEDNSFELTLVESLASFSCFKSVTDYYFIINWLLKFDNFCFLLTLGNCDFEGGFCKWMNMKEDTFDWTSQTGKTPSSQTGPSRDHTSGKVNYKITFLFMTRMSNNCISLFILSRYLYRHHQLVALVFTARHYNYLFSSTSDSFLNEGRPSRALFSLSHWLFLLFVMSFSVLNFQNWNVTLAPQPLSYI